MKTVPLLSSMEGLGRRREYSCPLLQGDIAASHSCTVTCLTHPRTFPLMWKISKAKCCVLWIHCYLGAALCLKPLLMKFDINWFQLHFQMSLSFGRMGTCFLTDYYYRNTLLSVNLQRGVEKNHALFICNFFSTTDTVLYSSKARIPLLSGLLW